VWIFRYPQITSHQGWEDASDWEPNRLAAQRSVPATFKVVGTFHVPSTVIDHATATLADGTAELLGSAAVGVDISKTNNSINHFHYSTTVAN
jgi:hypothetical protein